MSTQHQEMPMELEQSTYTCPYCLSDILVSNHDTHEARCARAHNNQIARPDQQINRQPAQELGRQDQRNTNGLRITKEHSSSSIPYPDEPVDQMRQPQIRREARRVADNKLVTCANCEKSIREQDLAQHQAYDCQSNDKIPCEFCNKQVPMTDYTSHIDNCPKRAEEMRNQGGQGMNNMQQEEVESEDEDYEDVEEEQPETSHERQQREQFEYYQQQRQQQQQQRNAGSRGGSAERPENVQSRQNQPQEAHNEHQSGGFMNFLKNLATVALQGRSDIEDSERPSQQEQNQGQIRNNQQRQQQQQQRPVQTVSNEGQQPGFISRLLGLHPETPEEAEQRRQQREARRQQQLEERRRYEEQRRERERRLLESIFEPRPPSGMTGRGMNGMMHPMQRQEQGQNQGNVRTIRLGPNGSFVITTHRGGRGNQMGQNPSQGFQPMQMRSLDDEMAEMGPLGILMSMMNGGLPGMRQISQEELQNMTQEEQAGLARDVMDSLSVIKYDKEKNKNVPEDAKSCPICIEDFTDGDEVRYLWCMHRFHKGCVDKWLEKHSNCPICKKEYDEKDVSYDP